MKRHRFTVVGNKDKVVFLAPTQNLWIKRTSRKSTWVSNRIYNQPCHFCNYLLLVKRVEVLIHQIAIAHTVPLDRASFSALSRRSFSATGGGLAFCCLRISLPHS